MTDTTELKNAMAKIQQDQEKLEEERRDRPASRLILSGSILGAIGGLGAIAVLAIVIDSPPERVDTRELVIAIVSGVNLLLGGILFGSGQKLRATRRGHDQTREELRAEIRDARPADAEAIGQLAREQEAQRDLLLQIHGALILAESRELHRNRQWEAELNLFRENGRKLFEGIHEHMAQEFDAMRRSVAALAETVVHAKGVAINGHDTKAGAQVIQLPSQDTIQALRRLAHRTAQVAEDNFEDTTG